MRERGGSGGGGRWESVRDGRVGGSGGKERVRESGREENGREEEGERGREGRKRGREM